MHYKNGTPHSWLVGNGQPYAISDMHITPKSILDTASASRKTPAGFERVSSMQHPQKGRYERVSPIAIVHRRNPCPFLKFLYLFVVTSCGLWEFLIQRKELILLTYFIIFSTCQPRLCQRVIGPSSLLEPEPWYVIIIKGIFWLVCVILILERELYKFLMDHIKR